MKKPISIISNDQHIKDDNVEEKKGLIKQQCELAKKLGVDNVCLLGDLIDSRKSQTLKVLNGVSDIFNIFKSYNLQCHIISGNHEKVNYRSDESFLDTFKFHPNVNLYQDITEVNLHGLNITFIPFWEDDILIKKLAKAKDQSIIFSHFGTNQSKNNDGSLHNSSITVESLKRFKKVMLGHFHQMDKIGSNIYHLPSLQQNNFGEDENKGFTVLYDDGSHELVKSIFKPFIKLKIDVNKTSKKEIDDYIKEYEKQSETANIRFILEGTGEKIKSISKNKFINAGIDIKTKNCEIDIIEDFDDIEITQYNSENIIDEFEEFCEIKELDFKEGLKYLK